MKIVSNKQDITELSINSVDSTAMKTHPYIELCSDRVHEPNRESIIRILECYIDEKHWAQYLEILTGLKLLAPEIFAEIDLIHSPEILNEITEFVLTNSSDFQMHKFVICLCQIAFPDIAQQVIESTDFMQLLVSTFPYRGRGRFEQLESILRNTATLILLNPQIEIDGEFTDAEIMQLLKMANGAGSLDQKMCILANLHIALGTRFKPEWLEQVDLERTINYMSTTVVDTVCRLGAQIYLAFTPQLALSKQGVGNMPAESDQHATMTPTVIY